MPWIWKRGCVFPPVRVIFDGVAYWLVDGFHRYHAQRNLGRNEIAVEVSTGVLADAQWQSLTANHTHGLRRTNDDKRKAVFKALKMKPDLSDNALAEHVGVATNTICKYRHITEEARKSRENQAITIKKPVVQIAQLTPRTGKDGKKYPRQRKPKPGISPQAKPILRGPSQPLEKKTHVAMPQDPESGAFALVSLFDRAYLEKLLVKLTAILAGEGGVPPVFQDLPAGPNAS